MRDSDAIDAEADVLVEDGTREAFAGDELFCWVGGRGEGVCGPLEVESFVD